MRATTAEAFAFGASLVGLAWFALLITGAFRKLIAWLVSRHEGRRLPDTIPEDL